MLFSLEALEARKGDALILHYGESNTRPQFIVIDGGPATVYRKRLRPRMEALHRKFQREDGKLDVRMLMVSHIDDDHIRGVNDWFSELEETEGETPYNIQTLWFNSFDEVLGNGSDELRSRLAALAEAASSGGAQTASFNADSKSGQHSAAVIASVGQGRALRARATKLAIPLNREFQGLVMAQDSHQNGTIVKAGSGLRLHVLCPSLDKLKELQEIWDKDVRKNPSDGVVAAFADRSVANLSSIVVVAEMTAAGGTVRRMLLTGDARGDHILQGLEKSALPKTNGGWHFDVFKLPHHGSDRNATEGMFRTITADHYIISANGEHDNPDASIVHWIARARGDAPYTLHLTNKDMVNPANGKDVSAVIEAAILETAAIATARKIVYRMEPHSSVCVDLGEDRVNY